MVTSTQSVTPVELEEKDFLIDEYILEYQKTNRKKGTSFNFYDVCKKSSEYINSIIESNLMKNSKEDYIDINHRALTGDVLAEKIIKEHIAEFLKQNLLLEIEYPSYYSEIVEAVFQEEYGWGPLSVWRRDEFSEGAKAIGTDIWFRQKGEYVLQDFKFHNVQRVKDLCQRFVLLDKNNHLDEHENTILETFSPDGVRISVVYPKRFYEPAITLRKEVVKDYSFEMQAQKRTIPEESILLFKILSRLSLNSVVAGPPESGKSHMLLSMFSECKTMHTFYVESSWEKLLRAIFPETPVIHGIGKGDELERLIFPTALRHDIMQFMVGEIRSFETEIYGTAGERGLRKLMGTLHNNDPVNIPGILARLNIQHHGGKGFDFREQCIRFAENLHFSVTMDLLDGSNKRVTGIQFYDLDPYSLEVMMYKIMDYDYEEDSWSFNNVIPERIRRILKRFNNQELHLLQENLDMLAIKYPMKEQEHTRISLQSGFSK